MVALQTTAAGAKGKSFALSILGKVCLNKRRGIGDVAGVIVKVFHVAASVLPTIALGADVAQADGRIDHNAAAAAASTLPRD